ncbi:MAG: hypothetical protein LC122_14295 [Chitinophagales bacterium]|nr:hypothetical protein [Chitinophagales bacterium]
MANIDPGIDPDIYRKCPICKNTLSNFSNYCPNGSHVELQWDVNGNIVAASIRYNDYSLIFYFKNENLFILNYKNKNYKKRINPITIENYEDFYNDNEKFMEKIFLIDDLQ